MKNCTIWIYVAKFSLLTFTTLFGVAATGQTPLPNCPPYDRSAKLVKDKVRAWNECFGIVEGTERDELGSVYKGEFRNGVLNGKGTVRYANGDVYDGYFKKGIANGKGVLKIIEGDVYEGEFKNGEFDGNGRLTLPVGEYYEGNWINGVREGKGKSVNPKEGYEYVGDFKNDNWHGRGKLQFADGYYYEGDWVNGKQEGNGKEVDPKKGWEYVGEFKSNKWNGKGKYASTDGYSLEGAWVGSEIHGYGAEKFLDGRTYEGEFKNGKRHGKGTFLDPSEGKYVGEWVDGERVGNAIWTYRTSPKDQGKGKWINDKFVAFPSSNSSSLSNRSSGQSSGNGTDALAEKYASFLMVQDCYELRYVGRNALELAKNFMKIYEGDFRKTNPKINVTKLWDEAVKEHKNTFGELTFAAKLVGNSRDPTLKLMCMTAVADFELEKDGRTTKKPF